MDRRELLKMLGGLGLAAVAMPGRAQAPGAALLPEGRRFVHVNFSNGGLGWLFTCLQPPSYLDTANRGGLATWTPSTPLDEVRTAGGGRFVVPRPLLAAFEAEGDRAALEAVLGGCVVFLGCGTGSPIHQTYAPSFQVTLGARTTDVASEVARYQRFRTDYPLLNLSRSRLVGTGSRAFLAVRDNDVASLFEDVSTVRDFDGDDVERLGTLLGRLNAEEGPGPYARALGVQRLAGREAVRLLRPPPDLRDRLDLPIQPLLSGGVILPLGEQPAAVRLARVDLAAARTANFVNTYTVGPNTELSALFKETVQTARAAAGTLAIMQAGAGGENVQLDGVMDDPHARIRELHDHGRPEDVHDAMLIKLYWLFRFLVDLEKSGSYAHTTVLVDGDFSRRLDAGFDDGGVNAIFLFSGTGRLRPGFYGDSGVDGGLWFRLPDLHAGAAGALLERQPGGGSPYPDRLALALVLHAMGMDAEEAAAAASLRADEARLIVPFLRV